MHFKFISAVHKQKMCWSRLLWLFSIQRGRTTSNFYWVNIVGEKLKECWENFSEFNKMCRAAYTLHQNLFSLNQFLTFFWADAP